MNHFRRIAALALLFTLALAYQPQVFGQTALTQTTIAVAVNDSLQQVTLTSGTGVAANSILFVDREAMLIRAFNTTTLVANVQRGWEGSVATAHAILSPAFIGTAAQFYQAPPLAGGCTRANAGNLPRIVIPAGLVYDCPVGTNPQWTLLNDPGLITLRSEAFNLDNGAGTTIDAVLIRPARQFFISACRIVYEDATTGTVATANARVGTTVGGSEIVASTAYANAVAVGTTTAMVVVAGNVPAGTPVLVRHTGVAITQAGEAVVECDGFYR